MKTSAGLALAALLSASAAARAQTPPSSAPSPKAGPPPAAAEMRKQIIEEVVRAGVTAAGIPSIQKPFRSRISGFQGLLMSYLMTTNLEAAAYKELLDVMASRADRQIGSSAGATGSTSLTSKGAVPQILGAAVEQGAFEKDVTGTTVTFRAKPAGTIRFLQSRGLLDIYRDYSLSPGARFASRFSAAVSFDTSRGSQAGTLTADKSQFSGWSVRGEIVNHRDAALSRYAARWTDLLDKSGAYADRAEMLHHALGEWRAFHAWRDRVLEDVDTRVEAPYASSQDKAAAAAEFRKILEARLPELDQLLPLPAEVQAGLDGYVRELLLLEEGMSDIYAFANKGVLLTLEFSAARDPQLPDLYTATAVLETALGKSRKTDLTLNGEASYYGSRPEGASHQLKNIAFSAELNRPLGTLLGLRSTTFGVAFRYSYLPHDTVPPTGSEVAPGGVATAPKGGIAVLQAKLTIPVKDAGVKVPLSVTFANRTEAIEEKVVRANFGVTLDLDTLLAAARARQ